MFGKKLERTSSKQTVSPSLPSGHEGEDPLSEVAIMPDSTDTGTYAKQNKYSNRTIWTLGSNDTLVTTPEHKTVKNSTSENQINVGLSLAETTSPNSKFDSGLESFPMMVLGESEESPIIIMDSSPRKPTEDCMEEEGRADSTPTLELKKRPLHPFFAPRSKIIHSVVNTSLQLHHPKYPEAAYPDSESQHVKGDQTACPRPPCPFERRCVNTDTVGPECSLRTEERVESYTPVLRFLSSKLEEEDEDPYDGDIDILPTTEQKIYFEPNLIREHPAIERVVNAARSRGESPSSSGQLWVDAWRPRCAKEVLGNKHSALYLRNWLHTLGIQLNPPETRNGNGKKRRKREKKRPHVIREVARKKLRRDGLDGFLVEDDEDDDDVDLLIEDVEDEFENCQRGPRHSGRDETMLTAFGSDEPETIHERLHNTILLAGPQGTGKTAAVFACAEELGWEVFEVYPGIGRRNGANVDNLVGEVGKNHLVRNKRSDIGQASVRRLLSENGGTDGETEDRASSGGGTAEEGIKQSIILLEEVDVLFKDDVNFWPAVTDLIRECRRPVICTCNGE